MIEIQLRKLGKRLMRGTQPSGSTAERTQAKKTGNFQPIKVALEGYYPGTVVSYVPETIDYALEASRATIFARTPWKWDRRIESRPELLEPLAKTFLERKGVSSEAGIAQVLVYVSDQEPEKLTDVLSALDSCLRAVGVESDAVGPPIPGSWYQVAVAVFRAAGKPLKKFKDLFEHVQMLETKKATANTKNAIALLEALNKTKSAAILVGPILILKAKGVDGERVVMKELSSKELQVISENSVLMQHPDKLMKLLENAEAVDSQKILSVQQPSSTKNPTENPPSPPQV